MELHQLRCFLAVAEEGGFNRATSILHITQPALSYQIKQLEDELGTRLFHRRPGGVCLTEAGRVLAHGSQELMENVKKLYRSVQELSGGVVGEIRIGTVNSVGIYILPKILRRLRERYPMARPTVLYRHSDEIMDALLSDQVDVALIANPRPDRRLAQETIIEEKVSLVCGPSHPFFNRRAIRPSELQGMPYIYLSPESPTGKLIREHLALLGISVDTVGSTDNVETVKRMVEAGLGVAYLPDMVTAEEVSGGNNGQGRMLARIDMGPTVSRKIVLVHWKNLEMTRAITVFIEELHQFAQLTGRSMDRYSDSLSAITAY
ncbi:MAG: LysR family transcriptional regulator [Deltaproteobacteria bacterium]|nr:LysR family transcriptional regulator [Deltaproteobacteria bacterium]